MRTQTSHYDTLALFVDDLPNGGVRIECSSCLLESDDYSRWDDVSTCKHCGEELHYPEGASW